MEANWTSAAFDAFLILIAPNGVPLAASDDLLDNSTDAGITATLTSSGTWTVVANSLRSDGVGDYYLSLTSDSCATGKRRRSVRH